MSQDRTPPEITPTDLKARLDQDHPLVLLDVREAFERDIADLPDEYGARHIPLAQIPQRASELDPSDPVVVYCRSGNRSAWVVQFLQQQGFESVWNLKGGVMGWREEVDPSLAEY